MNLTFRAFVSGVSWLKQGKCVRIDLDVCESERLKYGMIMEQIEKWFLIELHSDPRDRQTGHAPGGNPDLISIPQMKLLHVLWGKPEVIEWYAKIFSEEYGSIQSKEDCKRIFKQKMGIEHIRDLPREAAKQALDALTEFIGPEDVNE